MASQQTWIISMHNNQYLCPVCGYPELDDPAYDEYGCSSYEICPCCGTQFGYDDTEKSHFQLRVEWVQQGGRWWSSTLETTENWDAERQLFKAGLSS